MEAAQREGAVSGVMLDEGPKPAAGGQEPSAAGGANKMAEGAAEVAAAAGASIGKRRRLVRSLLGCLQSRRHAASRQGSPNTLAPLAGAAASKAATMAADAVKQVAPGVAEGAATVAQASWLGVNGFCERLLEVEGHAAALQCQNPNASLPGPCAPCQQGARKAASGVGNVVGGVAQERRSTPPRGLPAGRCLQQQGGQLQSHSLLPSHAPRR